MVCGDFVSGGRACSPRIGVDQSLRQARDFMEQLVVGAFGDGVGCSQCQLRVGDDGAARRMDRYSANCAANSRRRASASAAAPWNQNERCKFRPETGSTPTAIRISNTPGRRSRIEPWPHTPIGQKIGSEIGLPVDLHFRRPPSFHRLTRENTVTILRARQDSNLQPSDP